MVGLTNDERRLIHNIRVEKHGMGFRNSIWKCFQINACI